MLVTWGPFVSSLRMIICHMDAQLVPHESCECWTTCTRTIWIRRVKIPPPPPSDSLDTNLQSAPLEFTGPELSAHGFSDLGRGPPALAFSGVLAPAGLQGAGGRTQDAALRGSALLLGLLKNQQHLKRLASACHDDPPHVLALVSCPGLDLFGVRFQHMYFVWGATAEAGLEDICSRAVSQLHLPQSTQTARACVQHSLHVCMRSPARGEFRLVGSTQKSFPFSSRVTGQLQ